MYRKRSDDEKMLDNRLDEWGHWKRNYLVGLGNTSFTIEQQIATQEIFGDGNKKGGKKKEALNNVNFIENENAEHVDYCVKTMMITHRQQASVLVAIHVFQWTIHKIAKETHSSRYRVRNDLASGKTMLASLLTTVGIYKQ